MLNVAYKIVEQAPTKPCNFVAIWKIDDILVSNSYRILKIDHENGQTEFRLEMFDDEQWIFLSGQQTPNRVEECKMPMGWWYEGTLFVIDNLG